MPSPFNRAPSASVAASGAIVSAGDVLAQDSGTIPKGMLLAVGLLGVSVFINYIDRGSLSIAAPTLQTELALNPAQLGLLLSSFFWTYAGFQLLSGWLVERYNANWVLVGGLSLWAVATAATGFARGFAVLFAFRLILGAGESVAFPSYSKILAKHCPECFRGRANAVVSSGIAVGPAFAIFFGARLVSHYGWRPFFIGLGLLSLFWILPWIRWMPKGPGMPVASTTNEPSFLQIIRQRSAWGTFLGLFAFNYLSYFLLTWLPTYLVHAHNFSMEKMGNIGGAAYGILACSVLLCGWLADFCIARGGSVTRVRKVFTSLGVGAASLFCIAVEIFAYDSRLAVLFLFLTCASAGLCSSNLWAVTQTLAGPKGAGKWTGVQNLLGNSAGTAAPLLTGFIVNRTGHFFWAFAATTAILAIGAVSWAFVVGPIEPIDWDASGASVGPRATAS
jgi:ACS family D-galactonate transporter-like MFS transporter